jgi:hypothetical protein
MNYSYIVLNCYLSIFKILSKLDKVDQIIQDIIIVFPFSKLESFKGVIFVPNKYFIFLMHLNQIYIYNEPFFELPKDMVNITKNDQVIVHKSLTKRNNIKKQIKKQKTKIPGDSHKPRLISEEK